MTFFLNKTAEDASSVLCRIQRLDVIGKKKLFIFLYKNSSFYSKHLENTLNTFIDLSMTSKNSSKIKNQPKSKNIPAVIFASSGKARIRIKKHLSKTPLMK
jgi:hypothetical protein